MHELIRMLSKVKSGMAAEVCYKQGIKITSHHKLECRAWKRGPLLWTLEASNIVATQGLNDLLTKYFKGSSYTATWYVGLIDNAGWTAYAAGDTAAKITTSANPPTTNGWQELTAYSESVRQTLTLGTASGGSIDNSASQAVFTANASKTIRGAFIISDNTKGGTSGILYCEVDFSVAQPVISGNVLNETTTLTVS